MDEERAWQELVCGKERIRFKVTASLFPINAPQTELCEPIAEEKENPPSFL